MIKVGDTVRHLVDDRQGKVTWVGISVLEVRSGRRVETWYIEDCEAVTDGDSGSGSGTTTGDPDPGAPSSAPSEAPADVVAPADVLEPPPAGSGEPVVGWKDTNPKAAFGDSKVPFSTVSAPVTAEVGLAMLEGALKYGRHNYRVSGVRASTYFDAALRHLTAWWEGEDEDPDSGLPHVVKALACLFVLRDSQIQRMLNDDRPPKTPAGWQQYMAEHVKRLKEKYPNSKPPHTAK